MTTHDFDTVQAFARVHKEARRADVAPYLLVIRDGAPIALLQHTELSTVLKASGQAAMGYGADALAVVFEGVFPLVDTNPITGAPWQRGEADEVWRDHHGAARGWVSEVQVVEATARNGDRQSIVTPFQLTGADLNWQSSDRNPTGGEAFTRTMVRAFENPPADCTRVPDPGEQFQAAEEAPIMPPDRGRRALDVGLTRIIDREFTLGDDGDGSAALIFTDAAAADAYFADGLASWQAIIYDGLTLS